jgi:Mrp family chromosome partitioning ATPase
VLLVDADMRRARDPERRDSDGDPRPARGLSDILAGRCHWSEAIQDAKSFDAIAAGSPSASPAELLSGAPFGQLVDYLRKNYDFIVIDSPPFPLVVDALVVSAHADRVLTVLRVGNTDREAAGAHLRRFAPLGGGHGVIVNGIATPAAYGRHGYGAPYASESELLAQAGQVSAPA